MHIKSVTIRGFKTYRQETIVGDLSPHCNMVLGKNGSGKSNLLDAIQFVLSDKYSQLRADDRAKLLHEGAGRDTTVADVEIVFDNSDRQIPLDPPKGDKENTDVRVRRTIGGKKDQILVNNTPYTQQDFQSLLESTGMSRSNPYNMVEQNSIQQLATQSKEDRLTLFKDIAGTRVYDQRKSDSQRIMKETDHKRKTIDTVIETLQSRISDLEAESAEFTKFQTLDTTRRSLEYSIYEREREIATAKLEEIDKKRAGGSSHAEKEGAAYAKAHQDVLAAEAEIDTLKHSIAKAQAAKRALGPSHSDAIAKRTDLQLSVKDLQERLSGAQGSKAEAGEQLKAVQAKIADTRAKLETAQTELSAALKEEEKLETKSQVEEQRLQDVCAKRERSSKYKGKKERDADLKKHLTRVRKQREDTQRQADKFASEMAEAQAQAAKLQADIEAKEAQSNANRAQVDKINTQLSAKETSKLLDARKAAWKRNSELESEAHQIKTTLDKASRSLQITMDKDLYRGVESVRAIAAELKLEGVYGPLIELFTVREEYRLAVEVTAGNSLFGIVVDTDATAALVITELNKRKGGRVTFVPLNRIDPKRPTYPHQETALPMIQQLQYDKKYEKAMLQVFGKTMIARELSVAAQISSAHDLDTITLGGDRVDKKGAITGGFLESTRAGRLVAQAEIQEARQRQEQLQSELANAQAEIRQIDTDLARAQSEQTRLNELKTHLRSQNTQLLQDITQAKREVKTLLDTAARSERALPSVRATLASLDQQITSLETELASDFSSGLTAAEEAELKRLTLEVDALKAELVKIRARRVAAESRKSELDSLLFNNLSRQETELQKRLNAASQEDEKDTLARDEQELVTINAAIKELEAQMKKADQETEHATTHIHTLEKKLDTLRAAESAAAHHLSDDAKNMDKLLSQRLLFVSKREDCMKKIRELGALPQEAFDKYKGWDIKKLMAKLEKTNSELKKMSGVNKKALDQYTSFMEEREQLLQKKKELDDGRVAIEQLIDHLDAKKDEAIERTFKTIAKNFSEVFQELVPDGKATLAILTKGLDEDEANGVNEDEEDEDGERVERKVSVAEKKKGGRAAKKARHAAEAPKVGSFTGIAVKVSFRGVSSEGHQLSGGQQTVVALALIFAIQRCDPSPFYLLDEIDAALDPVYRTAIANMLRAQAANTQFICTTFHTELLESADKFYGVVFKANASFVSVIDKEQARELTVIAERERPDQ